MQNFKPIGQRRQMLWTNDISRDWRLRWVPDRYRILFSVPRVDVILYPMLGAESRFWWVKNCEVWTRNSRLTSSAWNIMRKERHCWRHNGDHDCRPLSLPLRCDRATLCLYDDLSQIKGVSEIFKLRKRLIIWQTSYEHGIRYTVFASVDTGVYPPRNQTTGN